MYVCWWVLLVSNHSSYLFSLANLVIFASTMSSFASSSIPMFLTLPDTGFIHTLTLLLAHCKSVILHLSVHLLTLLALTLWHSVLLHLLPLLFLPLLPLMIAFPKFQSLERSGTGSVTTTWKSVSSNSLFKIISVPDGNKHYLVENC